MRAPVDFYRRTGVVPGQDVPIIHPAGGQDVGAVLAHPDAVAVAGDGKGDCVPVKGDGEAGAAQVQDAPQPGAADGDAADGQGGDNAAGLLLDW